jgi:hypothetical protein
MAELPRPDALAFVAGCAGFRNRVTVRWGRGSWRMHSPVAWTGYSFDVAPDIHMHFPREQIDELATVLRA